MKECCTVDNMDASSASGSPSDTVNCLTCRTCGHIEPFVWEKRDANNVHYMYAEWAMMRQTAGMPVYNDSRRPFGKRKEIQ